MIKSGFSIVKVKSIDEEKRIIRGIASTPRLDRQGDIVVPEGAKYETMPKLMLYHNPTKPVGNVTDVKITKKGIEFEAELPEIKEEGAVKDRIDEAWHSLKYGLISAVSIGFRVLEHEISKDGGWIIKSWEWLELSLVPIPAQPDAVITGIKSLDDEIRAASMGNKNMDLVGKKSSEIAEKKTKNVKISIKKEEKEMKIGEKIKQFKEALAEKQTKLVELTEKSESETFDAAQKEEFDTLVAEVEEIKGHVSRLETAEKAALSTAKAVTEEDGKTEKKAANARAGTGTFTVKSQKLDAGIGFARIAKCKALSRLQGEAATTIAKNLYGEDNAVYHTLKSAVAAGTTTDATWAKPLVGEESTVYADFVEYLRPFTILGRLGQGGIPNVTTVPFRTRLITQTSGGDGYWVGEGKPKGLTKFDFTGTTLEPLKVANISVASMELLRDSSPNAERLIRDGLVKALAARLDIDFLDPTKILVSTVSPASITNGVVAIPSIGTDADAVRADIAALLNKYAIAKNPPTSGVILMSASVAITLMLMRNALGQREFPEITMNGGMLEGFPVITSQYISDFADSDGEFIFMVNMSDIWVGDEGGVSVEMSDQASLQMDNAPTSPVDASTVMVSLWQHNLVGFKAERTINWAKRRSTAVAVLSGVAYGLSS